MSGHRTLEVNSEWSFERYYRGAYLFKDGRSLLIGEEAARICDAIQTEGSEDHDPRTLAALLDEDIVRRVI